MSGWLGFAWELLFSSQSLLFGLVSLIIVITYLRLFYKPIPDIAPRGKVILVTGAASGIGQDAVTRLSALGCYIYACDIDIQRLNATFGTDPNVTCLKVDVTDSKSIAAARSIVEQAGHTVYAIVNSAGIAGGVCMRNGKPTFLGFLERDVDTEIWPTININLMGTIRVNQVFAEHILDSQGVFLCIASIAGLLPFLPAYAASKHAVSGYAKGLATELNNNGFEARVVCLYPGFIDTPMVRQGIPVETDFSQTRFGDAQTGKEQADKMASITNPVSIVSAEITRTLFTSKARLFVNHVIIDSPVRRVFWSLASVLPHFILNAILPKFGRKAQPVAAAKRRRSPSPKGKKN